MRLAKHVKFREESFGGVLFETRSEKVYTLTPTATALVKEIASGREAPGSLGSRLAERYAADEGVIERDVDDFVARLLEQGLVED
jgi:hypothetical protein